MESKNLVISTIMAQMPGGAEYYVTPTGGDYKLSIHWKLHTDTNRPNKYSKTIVITIPQELIEDFSSHTQGVQDSVLKKISQHIQALLRSHNPNHNSPYCTPEPVVNWDIAIEQLFG